MAFTKNMIETTPVYNLNMFGRTCVMDFGQDQQNYIEITSEVR